MDMDHGPRRGGGLSRVILLGDGSEINSNAADSEMFDHDEEDKDLESQVSKGGAGDEDSAYGSDSRSQREQTPNSHEAGAPGTPSRDNKGRNSHSDSPSSTATEKSEDVEQHKNKPEQNLKNSSMPADLKMMAAIDGAAK